MSIFEKGWPPPPPDWLMETDPIKRESMRKEAELADRIMREAGRRDRIQKAADAIRAGDPNWPWIVGNPHELGQDHMAAIALAVKEKT